MNEQVQSGDGWEGKPARSTRECRFSRGDEEERNACIDYRSDARLFKKSKGSEAKAELPGTGIDGES